MTTPTGLMDAFSAYERALMSNDVEALDRLFAPGADTLRGDAAGLLVGHDAISAFRGSRGSRGSRGGAPQRRILETHVQVIDDDHALVVAVTELAAGGRGQQTQLWERQPDGWVVTAAHVAVPAPAFDSRIWRVVGDPLVPALAPARRKGPLRGERVAVKDLYAVAGQRVGAGNPTWLATAPLEHMNAGVLHSLLGAGADVAGIARTDEFAYSLAGTNAHYGVPPNPRAPYRLPGGSTSGSATAVSLGHASIGLGTDTGGSIRVPAAYQGLFGIRTTHGALGTDGLMALAPSFDSVGWLTRDAALLAAVGDVLLPRGKRRPVSEIAVSHDLLGLAQPDVTATIEKFVAAWPSGLGTTASTDFEVLALPLWLKAFQTLQAWEAWQTHGWWLTDRLDSLGPDVRSRFAQAASVDEESAMRAATQVERARTQVREYVGDRVLVLPSASSVAPRLGDDLAGVRAATMQLTCLAGLAGLPAISLPLTTDDGLPCGVCLVAGPGRDRDLLALVVELTV